MKYLNLALILMTLLLLAANFLFWPEEPERGWEFLPDMYRSEAVETLSATPLLPEGAAQQNPVGGTIARGHLPLPFKSGDEDRARAGETLKNPVPANQETLQTGRQIFLDFCFPCHGQQGGGDGPVVARGFPAPPNLTAEPARQLRDGEVFHILTFGRANMPPYGHLISREERWTVILYLRSLQEESKQ